MSAQDLPFIDLHRHLEGSIRIQTILEVGQQHNLRLPADTYEDLIPHIQVTVPKPGVIVFLEKFKWMTAILVDYVVCKRVAYENILDASSEGIDYLELRFSPWFMAEPAQLDPVGVVEAVIDGVEQGSSETGLKANLIGIISRTYGPEVGHQELDALLSQKDKIVSLDLAGDEANFPGELFVDHFSKVRNTNWQITVHAGESAGPQSVRQAIEDLGAVRIGHATNIQKDPHLKDMMLKNNIGIEANLTSNVQTSTVSNYSSHPLKTWIEEGLLATINSDNPVISDIDLTYEYEIAAPKAGLTQSQIRQTQINALEIAFLSNSEKEELKIKKGE